MNRYRHHKNSQAGFTLVEILVAIGVFSVVILISVSIMLFLVQASNKAHAILTAINNLDYAMEQMTRTFRVGGSYYCASGVHPPTNQVSNCPYGSGKSSVSFTDQNNQRILYRHALGADWGRLEREHIEAGSRRSFAITSPEIFIEEVNFNVYGALPADGLQPRIVMRVQGRTVIPDLKEEDQVEFDLQSTVSSRNFEF